MPDRDRGAGTDRERELAARLALAAVPGLGPRRIHLLAEAFGSAAAALAASDRALARALERGGDAQAIRALAQGREAADRAGAAAILARCRSLGIALLIPGDRDYPHLLAQIDDPPPVLFLRGSLDGPERAVAVVGSRRATPYGVAVAERLAAGLAAAGVAVVSGLARGVDAAAHRGALAAGGRTVAVLGSGVDRIYPPEHRHVARAIAASGAVVSELPPGAPPLAPHFPARNRIISGMCAATVVVEAAEDSGALITADLALEQGRDVMAVPGPVTSPTSRGPHRLIREGARLVESAADVLSELGWSGSATAAADPAAARPPVRLGPDEAAVLASLAHAPVRAGDLAARLGLPAARVNAALSLLELSGWARATPAGHVRGPGPS